MLRALFYWLILAVLVGVAWYLADQEPGQVSIEWLDYRIDTSIGILLLAVGLLAGVAAVIYRLWRGLRRLPKDVGHSLRNSRQRRGYRALTQGMVAVAAGEAGEARRWAGKADKLLDEPPLTMLLSAQAAQLDGDDQAAKRYFTAMLKRDETRFLGLRGLITQALHDGDEAAALEYVQEAYTLRPRTPWVLTSLFDLSERTGDLALATRAVDEAVRAKSLPHPEAKRRKGVLLLEQARESQQGPDRARTVKLARQAHKAAPDLAAATQLYGELLVGSGRQGEAGRMLEKAWAAAPHPALVEVYRAARPGKTGIDWLNQVGKLVAQAPKHGESLLALAEAALGAQLWGEARRYLGEAAEVALTERVCRLMARLEDSERQDAERVREWLFRAAEALPDAAWVCGACGAVAGGWTARCGACHDFDSLIWQTPPHVEPDSLAASTLEGARIDKPVLAAEPVEVVSDGQDEPQTAPSNGTGPAAPAASSEEERRAAP
jgi:HemY protein